MLSVNGADGISDMEGKTAKGSGERVGKRASFKSVVVYLVSCFSWVDLVQKEEEPRMTRISRMRLSVQTRETSPKKDS